jgi:hypothetical protein
LVQSFLSGYELKNSGKCAAEKAKPIRLTPIWFRWEDAAGKVWISFNSVEYLRARHHVPDNLAQNIAIVSTLAHKARIINV